MNGLFINLSSGEEHILDGPPMLPICSNITDLKLVPFHAKFKIGFYNLENLNDIKLVREAPLEDECYIKIFL